MTFPIALTSQQLNILRGVGSPDPSYAAAQFVSIGSNTVVFKAQVNQASFAKSYAQVAYDTVTVGSFSDVEPGMTVFISSVDDIQQAKFALRVRKAATATTLFINETSVGIADDDFIFVVRDFRVWEKLARESN
ncbi:MAG: hypothetical protein CUN54_09400, partial [Phototrophicales bacterium]